MASLADDGMSMDERMDFLRARGVEIEESESRKASAPAAKPAVGPAFTYLHIPADASARVTAHTSPSARGIDVLRALVGPIFASDESLDERTVERETKQRLLNMMTGSALNAPSAGTIQKLAAAGGVEAYPLAQPTADNRWRSVKLYIDEIGALRQRSRNARAEKLAEAAGLSGLAIHGDAFVGRVELREGLQQNVDFVEEELASGSAWATAARHDHARAYESVPEQAKAFKAEETEAYGWSQTNDDVEVRVKNVPLSGVPLSKRVKVSYGKGDELNVSVDGASVLSLSPLFAPVAPDESSWSVDGDTIVITMEKRDPRGWTTITLSGRA
ncbi:hypothetical protein M885DRAFT_610166 [Pelagophyceae sp. CCMP2097]|nr:hypothetical protein M885DRAFT_610166 [Pelagophyceae sp. CCMP2097]